MILVWIPLSPFAETDEITEPKSMDTTIERVVRSPRIEELILFSEPLGRSMKATVILPAKFRGGTTDWPVLYLLHGRGRHHRSLVEPDDTRASLLEANFFIVLPNGEDGWYIDSPTITADRYAAHLTQVIELVASLYPVSQDRRKTGITGWSMGGYGAVRYAEAHPDRFGVVASIIGLLDFPRAETLPEGQNYTVPRERFGENPIEWRRYNPLNQADRLQDTAVLIVAADQAHDLTMNKRFAEKLSELGIEYEWKLLEGGHKFEVVAAALPIVLDFMAERFDGNEFSTTKDTECAEVKETDSLE
jgi:S-formylglutathione hydrolase FrmB